MWFISVPLLILILLVVGITVLVVKAGSVALRLTGMDEHRANFQAISAVTGTGFTTRESELVVADPVRRKIVSFLMIFGNVAIVMLISLLVGSFAAVARTVEKWYLEYGVPVAVFVVGGLLLYLALRSRGLTRRWPGRAVTPGRAPDILPLSRKPLAA
jgi:Trk-type K+ transport system membrane component